MPPAEASENRALDALVNVLLTIGAPAASWLTVPTVNVGIPPDSVPSDAGALLYVHHVRTEAIPAEVGRAYHRNRAYFHVYGFVPDRDSGGPRLLLNLKADVLRAVFAAEGSVTTLFGQPFFPGSFGYRDDMISAGMSAGVQELTLDLELSHTQP